MNTPKTNYLTSKKILPYGLVFVSIIILIIFFIPKLIVEHSWLSDSCSPNEIGDTLGGILGPIVGVAGVFLTFLAFWAQYDANIQQRNQFKISIQTEKKARLSEEQKTKKDQELKNKEFITRQEQFLESQEQLKKSQQQQQDQILLQDKRTRISLFESRFHTMLSIHRDNANDIEVNKIKGRKVFLHMLDELKLFYELFTAINTNQKNKVNDESVYNVAYLSFFFGIGEKSTPMVKNLVGKKLIPFVEKAHKTVTEQIQKNKNDKSIIFEINGKKYTWKKEIYSLGVGHLRRLGHYIRHLFQTVKFVDDQDEKIFKIENKYNYISNLRAQLSAHEQILLFYNAISVMGKPWLETLNESDENYIQRYCMIKSIPLNAADFYKKPSDFFSNKNSEGKSMFEWIDIIERMEKI